jgi:hypothetical protein
MAIRSMESIGDISYSASFFSGFVSYQCAPLDVAEPIFKSIRQTTHSANDKRV